MYNQAGLMYANGTPSPPQQVDAVNADQLTFQLISACSQGNVGRVQQLVDMGAHPGSADYDNRTPLHIASCEGFTEIATFLLARGAPVNAKDRWNQTPLDEAIRYHRNDVIELLKQNGGQMGVGHGQDLIDACAAGDLTQVQHLLAAGVDVNSADYDRRTPLHLAAAEGHLEVSKFLLERGANPKAEDRFGVTPIREANRSKQRVGTNELQDLFEQYGGDQKHNPRPYKFITLIFLWEVIMIILYFTVTRYSPDADPKHINPDNEVQGSRYAFFQDVHVMIFIGFGYLMTFLRYYGYSAVGYTFLLGSFCIQWHILVDGFFHQAIGDEGWHKVPIDVHNFLLADFASGAVLITYGGILGKTSPFQLCFIALIEIVLFAINENIGKKLHIADIGGTVVIHMFGAYFGLACARWIGKKEHRDSPDNSAVYHSDLFAMIGTVFLWMFWPSFNAATSALNQQNRVVCNTIFGITASCLGAYIASTTFRHEHTFCMVDIQNSTLAGGVALGSAADMIIHPGASIVIGFGSGIISVIGYVYITPFLEKRLGIHDTCGINNLHGMPSLIGGIMGVIFAGAAKSEDFGDELGVVFPYRVVEDWSASKQAGHQIAFIGITLAMALVGGTLVGILVGKVPFFNTEEEYKKTYKDDVRWEVPSTEVPYFFDARGEISRGSGNAADWENRLATLETRAGVVKYMPKSNVDHNNVKIDM